jgi:hypothetical protein
MNRLVACLYLFYGVLSATPRPSQISLPIAFEPIDAAAGYYASHTGTRLVEITPAGATLVFGDARRPEVLQYRLTGANRTARSEPRNQLAGKVNYFLGTGSSRAKTGLPMFEQVLYKQVYRGIDLVYYGNEEQLEYDFRIAPGAKVSSIRMTDSGMTGMRVDSAGNLILSARNEEIRYHKPRAYQMSEGLFRPVQAGYRIRGNEVTFDVGDYDRMRPLVIDPVLTFSTLLGGSRTDQPFALAVDNSGNVLLAGGHFLPIWRLLAARSNLLRPELPISS